MQCKYFPVDLLLLSAIFNYFIYYKTPETEISGVNFKYIF